MKLNKETLLGKLSKKQRIKLGNYYNDFKAILWGHNLNKLAKIYGTDKWGGHWYTPHYKLHLKKFKYRRIKLLEIGVGCYEKPDKGAHSLRMWKRYFPGF